MLATIDLRRWHPRVLLIEATEPATHLDWDNPEAHGRWDQWEPAILRAGYIFAYFDGLNRFYLREEDRHLAVRFRLPPGVFDEIENLAPKSDRAARLEVIESMDQKIKSMRARLSTAEAEQATQLAAIIELQANNARLRAKLKDRKEALANEKPHRCRRWARALRAKLRSLVPSP